MRTLARRQGVRSDRDTQEQPGKILHEVRRSEQTFHDSFGLPASYYGTVDATPLWVTLLHDAWRWGLAPEEVEQLLPHAESALAWMRDHADADGDGFLEYIDETGRGLANQGWKDSSDGIRYRDGRLAAPPIALCEVQAYAYEAARGGAALLRAFGRPGADRWEEWADRLRERFRAHFWVEDEHGRYPAVALDRDKRPVDSVTSGFGHLLGTGLLDRDESALLAARISAPDLDSGHGLRTLSSASVGYNPYGYHIGSIWPHDTAIAVHGLVRAGFPDEAAPLASRPADRFGGLRRPAARAVRGARRGERRPPRALSGVLPSPGVGRRLVRPGPPVGARTLGRRAGLHAHPGARLHRGVPAAHGHGPRPGGPPAGRQRQPGRRGAGDGTPGGHDPDQGLSGGGAVFAGGAPGHTELRSCRRVPAPGTVAGTRTEK